VAGGDKLDLTRLEGPLPIVPLVDRADDFVDRACSVMSRHPVYGGEHRRVIR
jgi:hypothetical protein